MSNLNSDQDVLKNGRKKALKDVAAPLREQVVEKLANKLEDIETAQKVAEMWRIGNVRRADWLSRNEKLKEEYDEFLESIYPTSNGWSSTLHLPVAFTVAKTYHARMLAALLGIDPPFTVKARQEANTDRQPLIQDLMRYTLSQWMNDYKGVDEVVDAWIWEWVTSGVGLLKNKWDRKYSRFIDVVEVQEQNELGQVSTREVEQEITKEVFNGPKVELVMPEDLLIVGGAGDPDAADAVIHQSYLTASELWTLVDQKIFRKEAVEKVIAAGENRLMSEPVNSVKDQRATNAGMTEADSTVDLSRYQILEAYLKIDVDGSGINSDVIVWVHADTRQILKATYLYRVMKSGLRPFVKIDFHKRHGQDYGVGLIELLYTLTKELDAQHNMKIDFGVISTMPMGFYRATSSLSEEKIPYEPGALIPLDNPQTDVFFPNLGNRSVFSAQEEQSLMSYIERVTSVSDISLGIVGGQGATRTATGTRALLGESNANLDVFLRRMNRGWRRLLTYVFHQLQEKMPPGFEFRIFGDDGKQYFRKVKSKEELCGMYDFELDANSANSNQSIRQEIANQQMQMVMNPLAIQLGIVNGSNIYEAYRAWFVVNGVKDYSKFINKPQGQVRIFSPEEIANRVLAGIDVPMTPEQDLAGFISYYEYLTSHDELLGQFQEPELIALTKKYQEAQAMQEAMAAQAAQTANAQQIQMNQALSSAPTQMTPGGGPQAAQGQQAG